MPERARAGGVFGSEGRVPLHMQNPPRRWGERRLHLFQEAWRCLPWGADEECGDGGPGQHSDRERYAAATAPERAEDGGTSSVKAVGGARLRLAPDRRFELSEEPGEERIPEFRPGCCGAVEAGEEADDWVHAAHSSTSTYARLKLSRPRSSSEWTAAVVFPNSAPTS